MDKEDTKIAAQSARMSNFLPSTSSATQQSLFKISLDDPDVSIYSDKAVEVAEAVLDSFGEI